MNKSGLPPFVRRYNTRFYFRFSIEVPRLTEAACFGITETQFSQLVSGQVENINREAEPGTPSRFPRATRFFTPEQASLECDRWRYRLNQDFSVPISRWSCGNVENLVCDLKSNLSGEMSLEFQDFVARNLDALESHRASQDNSEKQLLWLAKHGDDAQRKQASDTLARKQALAEFNRQIDVTTIRRKLESLEHYSGLMGSPLKSMLNSASGEHGAMLREAISGTQAGLLTIKAECEKLFSIHAKLNEP